MGLFQHKQEPKTPSDMAADAAAQAFDDAYREELRQQAKLYFERIIGESAALFKHDLDETIDQVRNELKSHVVKQLDGQLVESGKIMKDAQALALQSLNSSEQELIKQRQELSATLKSNIIKEEEMLIGVVKDTQALAVESLTRISKELEEKYQTLANTLQTNVGTVEKELVDTFRDNMTKIGEMREAQSFALESLTKNAQLLEQQYQQLGSALEKKVVEQEEMLVGAFENNMAVVVEHYLLGALGDQFDLKAQLPMIIQQMEANKEDIVGDMKL